MLQEYLARIARAALFWGRACYTNLPLKELERILFLFFYVETELIELLILIIVVLAVVVIFVIKEFIILFRIFGFVFV